jgi:L-ascorbate metabolism protein UlaG (beta-lactamase superfamily)
MFRVNLWPPLGQQHGSKSHAGKSKRLGVFMDIVWYGLSSFRIREAGVTIVTDPFDKSVGLQFPKVRADIVTVSHERPGHSSIDRVAGEPKVLQGPGEYEIKNVFITGATTFHRRQKDAPVERNVIFFFEFGDITIGHLGDIGEIPAQSSIEELNLGEVDVLLVPVGGGDTLDPTRAVEVIGLFEPKIVIPMHYAQPELTAPWASQLEPVEKFLRELGVSAPEPQDTLKFTKSNLPEETQVVLLRPSLQ